jgi:3-methyladenine DNA glycosylase Tag
LSWITILNKENFRAAFDQFDYKKIATYNDDKILDLLQDAGIIRNKLKVYSAVTNAKLYQNSRRIWFLLQIYLGSMELINNQKPKDVLLLPHFLIKLAKI